MNQGPWNIPDDDPSDPQLYAVPDTPPADWGEYAPAPVEPPAKPRWRFLSLSDLENLPRPKPLIANTFDQDALVLLAGDWGTYKSFQALDWAACIATGASWNNREVIQQSVLYIAGEGLHGIKQRLRAWEIDRGLKIPNDMFTLMPDYFQILDGGDINELVSYIHERGYKFIVIDTLARTLGGNEENSNTVMTQVVTAGDRIRYATEGGTVLVVHHTGKEGKVVRGGGSLSGGMDTIYMTYRGEDGASLKRIKRKDGPLEDTHQLEFIEVPGSGSGVLAQADPLAKRTSPTATSKALGVIKDHFRSTGGSKSAIVEVLEEFGISKSSAYRALDQLVMSGQMVNTGTDKRPHYCLREALQNSHGNFPTNP